MDKELMIQALLNKFRAETAQRIKGYEKKLRGSVVSQLQDEYNLLILGKQPKVKKVKKEEKKEDKYSFKGE